MYLKILDLASARYHWLYCDPPREKETRVPVNLSTRHSYKKVFLTQNATQNPLLERVKQSQQWPMNETPAHKAKIGNTQLPPKMPTMDIKFCILSLS